jgi:hypothetical protein
MKLSCLSMLYLATKPSHVRVDVDGLACSLQHDMVCTCQRGGQFFLIGVAPSRHDAVGGVAFLGDEKPLGLDI